MIKAAVLRLFVIVAMISAVGCGEGEDPLAPGTDKLKFCSFLKENLGRTVSISSWETAKLQAVRSDYILILAKDHGDNIYIAVPMESIAYIAVTPAGTLVIEVYDGT